MKIVIIHGARDASSGKDSVDKLAPYLEELGYEVDTVSADYGFMGIFSTRFRKHEAIRKIIDAIDSADVIIEYSNGASYGRKARLLLGSRTNRFIVFRLAPALKRSEGVANNVRRCWVFHSQTDYALWFSKFLFWLPWGEQGKRGYNGTDSRIRNVSFKDISKTHKTLFSDANIGFVARRIDDLIRQSSPNS